MMEMEQAAKQIIKPDHISYREYKKRLAKKPHRSFVVFVSSFFILLLVFLGLAKVLSPKVDLAIGDAPQVVQEQEQEKDVVVKGSIDDRLKQIQDEDNSFTGAIESGFSYELDEKVVIPNKNGKNADKLKNNQEDAIVLDVKEDSLIPDSVKKQVKELNAKTNTKAQEAPVVKLPQSVTAAPVPVSNSTSEILASNNVSVGTSNAPTPVVVPTRSYKVYVGNYDSAAQAEVAKVIIAEAGLSLNTFVKNVNGAYTLQAGAYSSQDTAFKVAEDLMKNNFPARVVAE